MRDAATLIGALGGSRSVAEAISKPVGTVGAWRHRNAIPVEEWPKFIALAAERGVEGVTAESLLAAHAEYPAERVDQQAVA